MRDTAGVRPPPGPTPAAGAAWTITAGENRLHPQSPEARPQPSGRVARCWVLPANASVVALSSQDLRPYALPPPWPYIAPWVLQGASTSKDCEGGYENAICGGSGERGHIRIDHGT